MLLQDSMGLEILCFHFCLFQDGSWFSFWFILWQVGCAGSCCLISMYVWIFLFSSCYWFFVSYYCGQKDTWYDFSLLKFAETCFVTYHVVCSGECFMYSWEEYVFATVEWNVLYMCLLVPFGLKYGSSPAFLCWFSVWMVYSLLKVRYLSPLLLQHYDVCFFLPIC